jgi:L-ribulose-5-phosphate 4-epimerase
MNVVGLLLEWRITGPYAWGKDANDTVYNAVVLEQISKIAYKTATLNSNILSIDNELLDKHFLRKHGNNSYYGQR